MLMHLFAMRTPPVNTTVRASSLTVMYTYDVVSESVRNPHELAAELTRRSQQGWEVVEITFDGAWYHAFIRHHGDVAVAPYPGAPTQSATPPQAPAAQQPASAVPDVPANWYKDPAGRFELRYWNGTAWTEHVASGGKQSVDPPKP